MEKLEGHISQVKCATMSRVSHLSKMYCHFILTNDNEKKKLLENLC